MDAVIETSSITSFDAVIPNEIGGMNAFEALLAACHFGKSTLDADCVARAYPFLWQTVRCLRDVSVVPAAVADGAGRRQVQSYCHFHLQLRLTDTGLRFSQPKKTTFGLRS